ncbi:MAG: NAD-dependent epimerase/dehydratase family protein, partial [Devosia sp.]
MGKRVIVTGGSGKVGRYVIPHLLARGHEVLNLDAAALDVREVTTVQVDLADAGQAYNALTLHFGWEEFRSGRGRAPVDAVVHLAAIPRILLRPDNTMFAANVLSTYNVVEAATKLGIRKIVLASSETAYGVCFAEGERPYT